MTVLFDAAARGVQVQSEGLSSYTVAPPTQPTNVWRTGSYLNPGAPLLTTFDPPLVLGSEYCQVFKFHTLTLPAPTMTNNLRTGSMAAVGLLHMPPLTTPRCV